MEKSMEVRTGHVTECVTENRIDDMMDVTAEEAG